jgi:hypothetical protein
MMRLDLETMLQLNAELRQCLRPQDAGWVWPHPWEHYPFVVDNERKWIRYRELMASQKQLVQSTLEEISRCRLLEERYPPELIESALKDIA